MNKVLVKGRICFDVEIKEIKEFKFIKNSIAVERYKKDGKSIVDYIPIFISGEILDRFNEYVKKGDLIILEGSWEVKNVKTNDKNVNYHQMKVIKFYFLPNKKEYQSETKQEPEEEDNNSDIDFGKEKKFEEFSGQNETEDEEIDFDSIKF